MTQKIIRMALLWALAVLALPLQAQGFPNKPIRLMLGYSPGGGIDVLSRAFAQRFGDALGQQIVFDNKPGASGAIAADLLTKSAPDGYTLFITETGYLVFSQLTPNTPDPLKAFQPVAPIMALPLLIAVPADSPAKNTRELIAMLKADPGKYSFGIPGIGTMHHLGFELFMQLTGINAVHIAYKGSPAIMPDLIGGRLAIGLLSTTAAAGPEKSGKLRVIATMTAQRTPMSPDWAALGEILPKFEATPRIFFVAPVGAPQAVVERLNEAARAALAKPDLKEIFEKGGAIPATATPEELRQQIAEDYKRWGEVAKKVGVSSTN